jgi:hypothetical protein
MDRNFEANPPAGQAIAGSFTQGKGWRVTFKTDRKDPESIVN